MKKKKLSPNELKNIFVITIYIIGAIVALNIINTLVFHIIGIALLIAAIYGIVVIGKRKKFLF